MKHGHQAILGAVLALPFLCAAGTASAAPPPAGHYVYVPPGASVVVLPGPPPVDLAAAPMPSPVASMIVQQDAMLQQMIADMDAMFAMPMPNPRQLMQAAMRGMSAGPGDGVILTSIGSGAGVCSESVAYRYPANGGAPLVHVTRSGNACGAMPTTGPASPVAAPSMPRATPELRPRPSHSRLWTASDPARPIGPADPRT